MKFSDQLTAFLFAAMPAFSFVGWFWKPGTVDFLFTGVTFLYLGMAFFVLFDRTLSAKTNMIFAGCLVVFSLPVAFSNLYIFASKLGACVGGANELLDYLYFSYVAFTTVGFGDLQPVGVCRALAATEAVVGYIALGGFVGATIHYFGTRVSETSN